MILIMMAHWAGEDSRVTRSRVEIQTSGLADMHAGDKFQLLMPEFQPALVNLMRYLCISWHQMLKLKVRTTYVDSIRWRMKFELSWDTKAPWAMSCEDSSAGHYAHTSFIPLSFQIPFLCDSSLLPTSFPSFSSPSLQRVFRLANRQVH